MTRPGSRLQGSEGVQLGFFSAAFADEPHALALIGVDGKEELSRLFEYELLLARHGEPLSEDRCGTDGCSIPTWAAPLSAFARGFARMATGVGLPEDIGGAAARIFDAATKHPLLVAGSIAGRGLRFMGLSVLIWLFGDKVKTLIEKYFEWLTVALLLIGIAGFMAIKYLL